MDFDSIVLGSFDNDRLFGSPLRDLMIAFAGNDVVRAGAGADTVFGGRGADRLFGGPGADTLFGGRGSDALTGGRGNDRLFGGAGADRFLFDPSDPDLGADVIVDFAPGEGDLIVLNGADVFRAAPDFLGHNLTLEASDFDDSTAFDLVAAANGALSVVHPGGTITLPTIPFSDGLTFTALVSIGALQVSGVVNPERFSLSDVTGLPPFIDPTQTSVLVSGPGDNLLLGKPDVGATQLFVFDPSNPILGDDVVVNFRVGQDFIALNVADIYRSTDGMILGEDGRFTPADLDDSAAFDLTASDRGNVLIVHPGGTIEVAGVPFAEEFTFAGLADLGVLLGLGFVGADESGVLVSATGDDFLNGEAGQGEIFRFDPSNPELGDDVVANFTIGEDRIVLNAADVFRADPDIIDPEGADDPTVLGTAGALDASDFDDSPDWDLTASERGDLVVVHPGGTIEVAGVPFSEDLSFEVLAGAGVLGIEGLIVANSPTRPLLTSRSGDDLMVGSSLEEIFVFDPSNPDLGDDVVASFELGVDIVELSAIDILASDPGIEGANGTLEAGDLDASAAWDLTASDRGNILVVHPGGTIEFAGIDFVEGLSFTDLVGPVIEVV